MATIRNFRPPLPISFTPLELADLADAIDGLPAEDQEKIIDAALQDKAKILFEALPSYADTLSTHLHGEVLADAFDHVAVEIPKFIKASAITDGTANLKVAIEEGLKMISDWYAKSPDTCAAFLARSRNSDGTVFKNEVYSAALLLDEVDLAAEEEEDWPSFLPRSRESQLHSQELQIRDDAIDAAATATNSKLQASTPDLSSTFKRKAQLALRQHFKLIEIPQPHYIECYDVMGKLLIAYAAATPKQIDRHLYRTHYPLGRNTPVREIIGRDWEAEAIETAHNKAKLMHSIVDPNFEHIWVAEQNENHLARLTIILDFLAEQPETYGTDVRVQAFQNAAAHLEEWMEESDIKNLIAEEWKKLV